MNCPLSEALQAETGCLLKENPLILFFYSKSQKYMFPSEPAVKRKFSDLALNTSEFTGYRY